MADPDLTNEEALVFIDSMRLTLVNRVGFRWMVEKLSALAAFVESVSAENETLNSYVDFIRRRDDYETYRAKQLTDNAGRRPQSPPSARPPA